ncbi:Tryptophan synthase alpha chain [Croceitalea dokdonensis DOKDO 023]|uniref:Tryptophan synthase alpha chain n=1 Tax=Croceitalea dokdonensis DOKDO 023 TaxID=1300341 RepID=A0A0P7AVB9_9FLAO|nr:tryptophan synthase subunit alpha [Croceitalea dokdonensis]KPM31824.1 Tryptophan synthase alpha chain [Croceitalea dokdonensis DOKDO 023]
MNRINQKMQQKNQATGAPGKLLSIYFTSGYPNLDDTVTIIQQLEKNGVDMVEIGLPFSDPLADGPTIQESSTVALKNGMTTEKLFEQLRGVRDLVSIPLIAMGYFNPMLQYGVEAFCKKCHEIGIDGIIMPDLPLDVYQEEYEAIFKKYGLINIFLITPQTSEERIREIDEASEGFIYMVSSASVTGSKSGFGTEQEAYFKRVASMNLKNPQIVGFGIKDAQTFQQATKTAKGGIIGSAFIKHLTEHGVASISDFIQRIR